MAKYPEDMSTGCGQARSQPVTDDQPDGPRIDVGQMSIKMELTGTRSAASHPYAADRMVDRLWGPHLLPRRGGVLLRLGAFPADAARPDGHGAAIGRLGTE